MVQQQTPSTDAISIGSQSWNCADLYMKTKVMKLLLELDMTETIALFGKQNMEEMIEYTEIPTRRIEAIQRMCHILSQLVGNCAFAIKEKQDKQLIKNYEERILNVQNVLDGISYLHINDITHENTITINEQHFRTCFDVLKNIKDELNFPLDRASLIFRHSDDIDIEDIMKQIVDGG